MEYRKEVVARGLAERTVAMSSNWPEVRKIVNAALDQPPDQRQAHAERACGNDATLREAVWSLLSDDSVPAGFLEPPIEGAGA